jgi:hypothetical protein
VPVTQVVEVERLWFKVNPGKVIRHYCTKKKKEKKTKEVGNIVGERYVKQKKKLNILILTCL